MAGKMEKVGINLSISPFQEMNNKTRDWCILRPVLKRKLKPIKFADKVEVDTNKWSGDELADELKAYVRYDLMIFDVSVIDKIKVVDKAKDRDKALEQAESAISSSYDKLSGEIAKKLSRAIDDLAGGSSNSKAIADGKAAIKKMKGVDLELVFLEVSKSAAEALNGIFPKTKKKKGTDDEGDDGPKANYIDAAKKLNDLSNRLKTSSQEAMTAIEFLFKIGKKISKNKVASDEMVAFGGEITESKKTFGKYKDSVKKYRETLASLSSEARSESLSQADAAKEAKFLNATRVEKARAIKATKRFRELAKMFKHLEKDFG
jgi:hypothetical protein